jgi:hypothetical protein
LILFSQLWYKPLLVARAQPQNFLEFDHGDQPVHDLVDAEARVRSPLV